ncbi:DUF2637 domain-containing protein [Streptomyces sp. NPDC096033]|uniref:DUF2637 domain-containing protein n=1 Tax=Streptomyces sp. NPDC096033 TaxID=3366071 RepID=UPI003814DB1A
MTDTRTGLAQLTGARKKLAFSVGGGALIIAGIGFAGSYSAVVGLARDKGFGDFAEVFPVGIDAGIGVLLALDLLLSWIRIPFPVLRHIAWLLTAATIAFNAAAAWPDPIAVGMHAAMPVLFVVVVEAVRHAVGRLADITADRHMEGIRIWRWLLSPTATAKLWRRMKLWELRSYEQAVGQEQDRLIYQARLQGRYGRGWRRKAPVEAVMPLRLAKLGVPLTDTAPAGLAAAGIEMVWRPAPAATPPFEEHALTALEVAGPPVHAYADAPSLPPSGPSDVDHEAAPPSLRALLPACQPVLAEEKPRGRNEVSARIPEAERPEEEQPVDLHDIETEQPETETGDAADESTISPEIPQATSAVPPPLDPLKAANERRAEENKKVRSTYASGWFEAVRDKPELTRSAYAVTLGISTKTLARAIGENTPA